MYDKANTYKILVVEDEADIRQVLCFFLRHAGFDVLDVSNGQSAIRAIPEYAPHLIILDLLMQPISGWDVLHWLRSQRLTPPLPVLVLSALVQLPEQVHGFEEGAIEYMTKPTQPMVLIERVRTLLSLTAEQRLLMQRDRMDEQRKTLDRLYALQPDDLW